MLWTVYCSMRQRPRSWSQAHVNKWPSSIVQLQIHQRFSSPALVSLDQILFVFLASPSINISLSTVMLLKLYSRATTIYEVCATFVSWSAKIWLILCRARSWVVDLTIAKHCCTECRKKTSIVCNKFRTLLPELFVLCTIPLFISAITQVVALVTNYRTCWVQTRRYDVQSSTTPAAIIPPPTHQPISTCLLPALIKFCAADHSS